MLSDIQIAQNANMQTIDKIAKSLNIDENDIELYGKFKAKIPLNVLEKSKQNKDGSLILVTAINPTPAGEGKTTTTIGLGQAMSRLGKKTMVTLREPSLGPVMGIKGGAAGGGYSQVVPMEDINLHFTGDIHAITSATNLLASIIDNSIHHNNPLGIDPRQILWKRALDINDRALRQIIIGLGGKPNGMPREDGFQISVASEIMAILCLAEDIKDLKRRLSKIIIGYTFDKKAVTAGDLKAQGALAALLKDAIKPNLVQTIENTPVIIHGGPFANIAHGCNSLIATKLSLKLSDYCITEAGFGADLGAEKFFNIKCRTGKLKPSAAVIVATIRALKYNGGIKKDDLEKENIPAIEEGFKNLLKHVENIQRFNVPAIVSINKFKSDTPQELDKLSILLDELNIKYSVCECFEKGGEGGIDLAKKVIDLISSNNENVFKHLYDENLLIEEKIKCIATKIYGAKNVTYTPSAKKQLEQFKSLNLEHLPICMAKTQYSLSDNKNLLGRPQDFEITIRELKASAGAGFIVAITGDVLTMPGLPKVPSTEKIDIDENAKIKGLF